MGLHFALRGSCAPDSFSRAAAAFGWPDLSDVCSEPYAGFDAAGVIERGVAAHLLRDSVRAGQD